MADTDDDGLSGGSTEAEYLDLLYGLVRVYKPALIFESGCHVGAGTVTLARACRDNCHGRVFSVDVDPQMVVETRRALDLAKLRPLVVLQQTNSMTFLRSCGERFDFLFLDSDLKFRAEELHTAIQAGTVIPGAIVAIHDTSKLRGDNDGAAFAREFNKLALKREDVWHFPHSRGMTICRVSA